jgi:hypothetical protein
MTGCQPVFSRVAATLPSPGKYNSLHVGLGEVGGLAVIIVDHGIHLIILEQVFWEASQERSHSTAH